MKYFVAVAEELNYRKASDRLHVAPPALSKQIKDLEAEIGVQLLIRDTGGVRLTEAGATFLIGARRTLTQAESSVLAAREAANGRLGKLNIGYVAPSVMGFMPDVLSEFHKRYPSVEVALIEMTIEAQIAAVESGTLQIGFTLNGDAVPSGLSHECILRSRVCAAMSSGHRLASRARISLADLADEQLLAISLQKGRPAIHAQMMRKAFSSRDLRCRPIRQIEGSEAFRAALEGGTGITLIMDAGSLSRSPYLVFRPLKETGPDLLLGLEVVWIDDPSSRMASNFVDVLRELEPRKPVSPSGPKRRA